MEVSSIGNKFGVSGVVSYFSVNVVDDFSVANDFSDAGDSSAAGWCCYCLYYCL